MKKPKQLKNNQINLDKLIKICESYIDFIDNDDRYYEDNDFDHHIFEVALETIFGEDAWKFVNNRQNQSQL